MKFSLFITLFLGVQLVVTHALALSLFLYWKVWWLDISMHLLGGIWLVAALVTLRDMWNNQSSLSVQWLVGVTAPVLIGWEIFGVFVMGGLKPDFWLDTSLDLLCGIVGVLFGYWLLRRIQSF